MGPQIHAFPGSSKLSPLLTMLYHISHTSAQLTGTEVACAKGSPRKLAHGPVHLPLSLELELRGRWPWKGNLRCDAGRSGGSVMGHLLRKWLCGR